MSPSPSTLTKLRTLYQADWRREWPYDNQYLTELWLEAREATGALRARRVPGQTWAFCLQIMRQDHSFAEQEG